MSRAFPPRSLADRIWSLAWPTALYALLDLGAGFADLWMVRGFGQEATAAIGMARQVAFVVQVAAMAVSTGVITLVSQGIGAQNRRQTESAVAQSLLLILVLSVPSSVAGWLLSRPLLVAMQAEPQTLSYGVSYLRIYFAGIICLWGNYILAAIFRGAGDARTPLKLASVLNVLNVGLTYVFIFVFDFRVAGAALGTVTARGLATCIAIGLLLYGTGQVRLRPSLLRYWDGSMMRRMLRIGLPAALAGVVRNAARLAFLGIVAFAAPPHTAHAAVVLGFEVARIGVLLALAFQVATQSLVGQAIGRAHYREAEALGRRAVMLLGTISVVLALGIVVAADPIGHLFIRETDAADLAAGVLRWVAVATVFNSLGIAVQGTLHAAGDTAPSLHYTVLAQWLFLLPLAYVLPKVDGWGLEGAMAAWTLSAVLLWLLLEIRFRSGRWKSLRV